MFSNLAKLIDRRPWWVLAIALAITAVAAPLGIHVRDHLKPRGFDVAGSGSAQARQLVAKTTNTDPASSVLALVDLPAPYGAPGARGSIGLEPVLGRDRRDRHTHDQHAQRRAGRPSRDHRRAGARAIGRRVMATHDDNGGGWGVLAGAGVSGLPLTRFADQLAHPSGRAADDQIDARLARRRDRGSKAGLA